MAMNIYDPNSRILRVNIPKVEIGDVVHSVTRMTIDASDHARRICRRECL